MQKTFSRLKTVNYYDANNDLIIEDGELRYLYTNLDRSNKSAKLLIDLLKDEENLKSKVPVYLLYSKNNLDYVYFPKITIFKDKSMKSVKRAFQYDTLSNSFFEIKDKKNIEKLNELEIGFFYHSCKDAFLVLKDKIKDANEMNLDYKIILPRTGATYLLKIFQEVFHFKVKRSEIIDVKFSSILGIGRKRKMKKALYKELNLVFREGEKKYLIVLDTAVSGSSVGQIFEIFKSVLNHEIEIKFSEEKKYLKSIIKKKLGFFLEVKKDRENFDFSKEYLETIRLLMSKSQSNQNKRLAMDLLDKNIDYFNLLFKKEFLAYLIKEKKYNNNVLKSMYINESVNKEEYYKYLLLIKSIKELITSIKEQLNIGENPSNKIIKNLDKKIQVLIKIEDDKSLLAIALGRKIYEEWMAVFGLKLFFIIIWDTKNYGYESFKDINIRQEIFKRCFGEIFPCLGIPTEDIISHERKEELLREEFSEYYEKIGKQPEFQEVIESLKWYRDNIDQK